MAFGRMGGRSAPYRLKKIPRRTLRSVSQRFGGTKTKAIAASRSIGAYKRMRSKTMRTFLKRAKVVMMNRRGRGLNHAAGYNGIG